MKSKKFYLCNYELSPLLEPLLALPSPSVAVAAASLTSAVVVVVVIVVVLVVFHLAVIGHGIVGKDIPIMARLTKVRRWSKR